MEKFPFLVFKDRKSLDFGLYIASKRAYDGAARDVTYTSIPGRSGDLITDNGRYMNIDIPYEMTLLTDLETPISVRARHIKEWLLAEPGYFQLWDSYDSEYFRMASYKGGISIDQQLREMGTVSLTFNCKPFKYAFPGQAVVTFTKQGTLTNPEAFPSAPYIKVFGSGTVTLQINGSAFLLKDIDEYVELDFEFLNAYKGTVAKNHLVSGADMSSFHFQPGSNAISWVGSVTKLEIIPRWCSL